jgi:peptide/nickel transport system permease protein
MSLRQPALLSHRGAVLGLGLLGLVLFPAFAAPWLPLADPTLTAPAQRMLPAGSLGHWLGTDASGRDLLSRLIWGARSSVLVGVSATLTAALIGTLIGVLAGFFGRLTDALLMRGVDVLMAFPYLLLALAIVAALGPGLENAMLAIAIANVPFFARAVRGAVLEIRHQAYIDAARLAGHREPWIIVVEVLPNLVPTVLLLMTTTLGWMVLETAGLSFLGLGAQPPDADLGAMLGEGRELLTTYPRVAVLPGLVILILVVGINLFGDALRDRLDPRLRERGGGTMGSGRKADAPADPVHDALSEHALPVAARSQPGLLEVDGLSVMLPEEQGPVVAVDRLDLRLQAGERVGLVGESGSGKSLTALALLGFAPPGGRLMGAVRFAGADLIGLDIRALRDLRGRRIAYIPQEPLDALDPLRRVGDQLREAIQAHPAAPRGGMEAAALDLDRVDAEAETRSGDTDLADVLDAVNSPHQRQVNLGARVEALLAMVGLAQVPAIQRRFPHELSGGQRQRVVIAMALAHEPDLLIADEATTALDVTVQAEIVEVLDRLSQGRNRTLLFVSHDLALVASLCERVLVLYAGRLVEDAPLEQLLQAPAHPYTAGLLACSPELGRPEKPLSAIPGQPPGPRALSVDAAASVPGGCRFAPRCPQVQPRCNEQEPGLEPHPGQHWARCWFPLTAA